MRFRIINISVEGYKVRDTFDAPDLPTAARRHVDAYRNSRAAVSMVLRGPDGKRYSVNASEAAIRNPLPTTQEAMK